MTGVKTFPFFDQGGIFWTAETISAKLLTGEATGATSQRGTWAESIQNMNNRGNE